MNLKDKNGAVLREEKISVDIVIPAYNEEAVLEDAVKKVVSLFSKLEKFDWHIVIASNGSLDRTREIGEALERIYPRLTFFHIPKKGRGRALKKAFSESKSSVCAYTDADLSVDINILPLLIEQAVKYKTIAMPNRLAGSARVKRPVHRVMLSKCYNLLIKALFPKTFIEDAQVGMKVIPRVILTELINYVKDDNFFFDTELSLLAERAGYKVIQLPADCCDMRRGRIKIVFCILQEFLGLVRMRIRQVLCVK